MLDKMTRRDLDERYDGRQLLELLRLCGWSVRRGSVDSPVLNAVRENQRVSASGKTFAEAIGNLFVRAMRSGGATRKLGPLDM
jgi:hypothetical protein